MNCRRFIASLRTNKSIRPFYRSCRQRGMEIGNGFTTVLPRLRPEAASPMESSINWLPL